MGERGTDVWYFVYTTTTTEQVVAVCGTGTQVSGIGSKACASVSPSLCLFSFAILHAPSAWQTAVSGKKFFAGETRVCEAIVSATRVPNLECEMM